MLCRHCDIDKPSKDFPPAALRGVRGKSGWCRACNTECCGSNNARRLYGLTPQAVESRYVRQFGKCKCCRDRISLIPGTPNYRQIDHDHSKQKGDPGFIRGLLCFDCNTGLGKFKDDPRRLRQAAEYLENQ
jgi:hypothetical protein